MLFLQDNEISLFAPIVAANTLLASQETRLGLIRQASASIDGYCGRARYGLAVREIRNVTISLSQTLSGRLPTDNFIDWIGANADIFYFGNSTSIGSVLLADFSVDKEAGVIRNLGTMFAINPDWPFRSRVSVASPRATATLPYHAGSSSQIEENASPYRMTVSFKAGIFAEKLVGPSGQVSADQVSLVDTVGVDVGREFYFSSDIENEPTVDRRFVTAVDHNTNLVTFEPVLGHTLAISDEKFRMIDFAVRSACGDIISDLITYPPNTRNFSKGLGKGDITKQWVRMNDFEISMAAALKLSGYIRV